MREEVPDFIPAAKPIVGAAEMQAISRVIESGVIAQGREVERFEQEFGQAVVEGRECVAVNSGTSGLHLGLIAAGIGPGDEVVVPSFTFAATANSVALSGATPVFADIDPETYCLDPASVLDRITPRTRAVMPVHLYGHPADMTGIGAIAREHDLMVFEDAAQAHGAEYQGQKVGTFGTFAMFSLYPTKNMTSGEGGMVSCSGSVSRRLRLLRNQGMERQYENELIGFNARMTDLHAAVGRAQLGRLVEWTSTRRSNAAYFNRHLENVVTPTIRPGATHVFHQYTIRVATDRDAFVRALKNEFNVGAGVYYPIPNHELASLAGFHDGEELPETRRASDEVVSIPVHPSLTEGDLERIVEAVNLLAKAGA